MLDATIPFPAMGIRSNEGTESAFVGAEDKALHEERVARFDGRLLIRFGIPRTLKEKCFDIFCLLFRQLDGVWI
jgi:hypothetical protein